MHVYVELLYCLYMSCRTAVFLMHVDSLMMVYIHVLVHTNKLQIHVQCTFTYVCKCFSKIESTHALSRGIHSHIFHCPTEGVCGGIAIE